MKMELQFSGLALYWLFGIAGAAMLYLSVLDAHLTCVFTGIGTAVAPNNNHAKAAWCFPKSRTMLAALNIAVHQSVSVVLLIDVTFKYRASQDIHFPMTFAESSSHPCKALVRQG